LARQKHFHPRRLLKIRYDAQSYPVGRGYCVVDSEYTMRRGFGLERQPSTLCPFIRPRFIRAASFLNRSINCLANFSGKRPRGLRKLL